MVFPGTVTTSPAPKGVHSELPFLDWKVSTTPSRTVKIFDIGVAVKRNSGSRWYRAANEANLGPGFIG
jgi:hypothetical protein